MLINKFNLFVFFYLQVDTLRPIKYQSTGSITNTFPIQNLIPILLLIFEIVTTIN